jgi:hypothetical protein
MNELTIKGLIQLNVNPLDGEWTTIYESEPKSWIEGQRDLFQQVLWVKTMPEQYGYPAQVRALLDDRIIHLEELTYPEYDNMDYLDIGLEE